MAGVFSVFCQYLHSGLLFGSKTYVTNLHHFSLSLRYPPYSKKKLQRLKWLLSPSEGSAWPWRLFLLFVLVALAAFVVQVYSSSTEWTDYDMHSSLCHQFNSEVHMHYNYMQWHPLIPVQRRDCWSVGIFEYHIWSNKSDISYLKRNSRAFEHSDPLKSSPVSHFQLVIGLVGIMGSCLLLALQPPIPPWKVRSIG